MKALSALKPLTLVKQFGTKASSQTEIAESKVQGEKKAPAKK